MTQLQLETAVAATTGEALALIHRRGFQIVPGRAADLLPEDLALVLDCPFCGRAVPYPGLSRRGEPVSAECLRCDVYFEPREADVYAAPAGALAPSDAVPARALA